MSVKFCATSALGVSWQHLNHPNLLVRSVYRFHVYFHVPLILYDLEISLPHEDGFSKVKSSYINPIQDGLFWGCSRMGGQKGPPSLKSVKLILQWSNLAQLYLTQRRSKKIYESRDTPLEFCWHQHFFKRKSANFAISRNTDIDCILIHNFYLF